MTLGTFITGLYPMVKDIRNALRKPPTKPRVILGRAHGIGVGIGGANGRLVPHKVTVVDDMNNWADEVKVSLG